MRFLEKGGMLALNGLGAKKMVEGNCPVCGGLLEEEAVLISNGSTKVVHKCLNLSCAYFGDAPL